MKESNQKKPASRSRQRQKCAGIDLKVFADKDADETKALWARYGILAVEIASRKKTLQVDIAVSYRDGECTPVAEAISDLYNQLAKTGLKCSFNVVVPTAVDGLITRNALRYHMANLKFRVVNEPAVIKVRRGTKATEAAITTKVY